MTDFIDVLEQQLVAAHGRRPRPVPPWRTGVVLVAAAGAAAAVVALVLALASAERAARPPAATHPPAATTTSGSGLDTSIAVLNGTTVVGLARVAADELTANGYPEPVVVTNDATNESRQYSEIYYERGQRQAALGVAACLGIRFDRVHPMGPRETRWRTVGADTSCAAANVSAVRSAASSVSPVRRRK